MHIRTPFSQVAQGRPERDAITFYGKSEPIFPGRVKKADTNSDVLAYDLELLEIGGAVLPKALKMDGWLAEKVATATSRALGLPGATQVRLVESKITTPTVHRRDNKIDCSWQYPSADVSSMLTTNSAIYPALAAIVTYMASGNYVQKTVRNPDSNPRPLP